MPNAWLFPGPAVARSQFFVRLFLISSRVRSRNSEADMSETKVAILTFAQTILSATIRMQHSNALMATSSLDRISGANGLTYQPYNNFKVQTLGGNIIQGQVNKIRVAEVFFPYDIPTIVQNKNDAIVFNVVVVTGATGAIVSQTSVSIVIPPGFYTAAELAAAISLALPGSMADLTVAVDPISNAIYMVNSGVWDPVGPNSIFIPYATPGNVATTPIIDSPTLLWTMGFRNLFAGLGFPLPPNWPYPPILPATLALVPENYPNVAPNPIFPGRVYQAIVGTPYVGSYTQYIDICSPSLCQAQYVRDGNTNQTVIRRDLVARIYVASEVSTVTADPPGVRPFIIHRQFKNAKIMKWTAERSIDSIDLVLYDQYGLPIPNSPAIAIADLAGITSIAYNGSRDYAITFLVDEHDETKEHNNGYTM